MATFCFLGFKRDLALIIEGGDHGDLQIVFAQVEAYKCTYYFVRIEEMLIAYDRIVGETSRLVSDVTLSLNYFSHLSCLRYTHRARGAHPVRGKDFAHLQCWNVIANLLSA